MQVAKYSLVHFFPPISKRFICSTFFSYCIRYFQLQVYIAETKCTEHLLFLTYNPIYHCAQRNKIYCVHIVKKHTVKFFKLKKCILHVLIRILMLICIRYQGSFISYLCTRYHFISLMNETELIYSFFVISFCTYCIVYCQNRSVNIQSVTKL